MYLQEVIDLTWAVIVSELSTTYDCYSSSSPLGYYVAILVHKTAVTATGSTECLDFSTSHMGRQLLQLPVRFAGTDILLMTSHLESTKECGQERKRQLGIVFDLMKETCAKNPNTSCVFGGDLNLRDNEVRSVGVPPGMVDVWEACGSPPSERYTWDVKENDNLHWPYPNRPSCRFDRLYLMPDSGRGLRIPPSAAASPSAGGEQQARNRFVLVGKARLSKCGGRFPSDHWGMWAEFEILYH